MAEVSQVRCMNMPSSRSLDSPVASSRELDSYHNAALYSGMVSQSMDAGGFDSFCQICGLALGKRRLNPRHHCRICGRCVCSACSPSSLKLDGHKGPQRVCTPCAGNVQNASLMISRLGVLTNNLNALARSSRRPQLYTFGDRCFDEADRRDEEASVASDSLTDAVAGVESTVERLRRAFEADEAAYREAENALMIQQETLRQLESRNAASAEQLDQLGCNLHELCDDTGAKPSKRAAIEEQPVVGKPTLEESISFCRSALGALKELREQSLQSKERVHEVEAAAKQEREQSVQTEQAARDRILGAVNGLRAFLGLDAVCELPDLDSCMQLLEETLSPASTLRSPMSLDPSISLGSRARAAEGILQAVQRLSARMRPTARSSVPEVATLEEAVAFLDALPALAAPKPTDQVLVQTPTEQASVSRCIQRSPNPDDELLLYTSPSSSTKASISTPVVADEKLATDSAASTDQSELQETHRHSSCKGRSAFPRDASNLSELPADTGPRHKACAKQCAIM